MTDYEIRIVRRDYRTSHVFVRTLSSDFAAIRGAHALVRPGQGVEVWRGEDCIYANHHDQPLIAPLEKSMSDAANYEIRILRGDLQPSLIWNSVHHSDTAAIRVGVRVADGHAVEIWRDLDCIFRSPPTLTTVC
jgi:hypothetical protein